MKIQAARVLSPVNPRSPPHRTQGDGTPPSFFRAPSSAANILLSEVRLTQKIRFLFRIRKMFRRWAVATRAGFLTSETQTDLIALQHFRPIGLAPVRRGRC